MLYRSQCVLGVVLIVELLVCHMSTAMRVAVIGAGTSGLSAARYLQDHSAHEVVVVEANDRVGGRVNTILYNGKPIELGAMWIHGGESKDQIVADICRSNSIDIKTFDFRTLNHSYSFGQEAVDETTVDDQSTELDRHLMRARRRYMFNDEDASLDDALKETQEDFFNSIRDDNISNYFNWAFIEETYSDSRSKISIREFDNEDEPDLDMVVVEGYQTFLDLLINGTLPASKPLKIQLSTEVTAITRITDQVQLTTKTGTVLTADAVVVTVSLGVLKANSIKFSPSLTAEHLQAIKRIGFGDFGKVVMIFDRQFWPDTTEWFVVKSDPPGYPLYFISLKNLHGLTGLIAVITGPNAFLTDGYSDDVVLKKMMSALKDTFGAVVDSAKLVFTTRTKWSTDPLYRGAYSYGAVGMTDSDMANVRKPLAERIFFAGEHTSWSEGDYATVDVAYKSGIRAAEEVISLLANPPNGSASKSSLGLWTFLLSFSLMAARSLQLL